MRRAHGLGQLPSRFFTWDAPKNAATSGHHIALGLTAGASTAATELHV